MSSGECFKSMALAIKSLYCQPEVCVNGRQSYFMWMLVFDKGVFCHTLLL